MGPKEAVFRRHLELKEAEYSTRKAEILNRLRLKWSTRQELQGSEVTREQVAEWIKPLVLEYISDRPRSLDVWLSRYTEWAVAINSWSREEKRRSDRTLESATDVPNEPQDRTMTNTDSEAEPGEQLTSSREGLHSTSTPTSDDSIDPRQVNAPKPAAVTTAAPLSLSQNISGAVSTKHETLSLANNMPSRMVDWDNAELAVDATVLGLGNIWLPLIHLKPVKNEVCHWSDFTFDKLISSLEEETGAKIDTGAYQFVYDNIKFTNPRAWNIVLKRFGDSAHDQRNILRLTIQRKEQTPVTVQIRAAEDHVEIPGVAFRQRHQRAKSSFDGGLSDFSDNSEGVTQERGPGCELPQRGTRTGGRGLGV